MTPLRRRMIEDMQGSVQDTCKKWSQEPLDGRLRLSAKAYLSGRSGGEGMPLKNHGFAAAGGGPISGHRRPS